VGKFADLMLNELLGRYTLVAVLQEVPNFLGDRDGGGLLDTVVAALGRRFGSSELQDREAAG
jgi:hypothetical protein